jgi:RNA polymerase sigma-70 factor (ECF subfamily)
MVELDESRKAHRLARQDHRFEEAVLPHLDAAFNLARWLMRNDADAEDVVQDACLRALRFIGGLRGNDGRVWLLKIVRNTCYSRFARDRRREHDTEFDEEMHSPQATAADPEAILVNSRNAEVLNRALGELPEEFREVIVMRELEGLSYKEIAEVACVPLGTVMSRLARARGRLQRLLGSTPQGAIR